MDMKTSLTAAVMMAHDGIIYSGVSKRRAALTAAKRFGIAVKDVLAELPAHYALARGLT